MTHNVTPGCGCANPREPPRCRRAKPGHGGTRAPQGDAGSFPARNLRRRWIPYPSPGPAIRPAGKSRRLAIAASVAPPPNPWNLTPVFTRLGCLFIVVPLVELALLVQVGRWVGLLPTITLVAVTGLLGVILVRREGTRTLRRIEGELQAGRLPHGALMDGAALLVAGAFLMTPGVITDALAFALLVPWTRRIMRERALARMRRAMEQGAFQVRVFGAGPPPGGRGWPPSAEPRRDARRDPRREDDDDPPPRPGEIIQE